MVARIFAPAKVNLTLHVTGQRDDGYHLLDSLVVFADIGDWLQFEPAGQLSLNVNGPFAAGVPTDAGNLVWQAAQGFDLPVAIRLEKNLPHGAGIGGGSSDAAATLRAMSELTGRPVSGAAALGADVPVCLQGCATRMSGIGDVLTPVDRMPSLWAVLVNPGVGVATPTVFRRLEQKSNPPMSADLPEFTDARDLILWLADQRNDLQAPAIAECPLIKDVLTALSAAPGVGLARMSGSGATCFALFDDPGRAEASAKALSDSYPEWWVQGCLLS